MTGAIIGSALLGAASSKSAADSASNASAAATAASAEASAAQLEFNKEQYEDWQAIYGDTQEILSSYYNTLTPEVYAATGIQNIESQYSTSKANLERSLAQKGITQSGITAGAMSGLEVARASANAAIQTEAPQQVANAQANFLSIGMGNQAQLQGNISSTLGSQATMYAGQATNYTNQAAQAYSGIGQSIGSGVSSYMQYQAMQPQIPQQTYTPTVVNQNTGGFGIYGVDYY